MKKSKKRSLALVLALLLLAGGCGQEEVQEEESDESAVAVEIQRVERSSIAAESTVSGQVAAGDQESVFLALFDSAELSEQDRVTYRSFLRQCERARTFLLIADNCGEIVLDKLFLQQLKQTYPQLDMTVMVRGDEVLNDATEEDARYVQLDRVASVISNGSSIAGTVYELLPHDAKEAFDRADVILAKGQGNYESICGQGHHVFYSFLCKCELFTSRFQVPKLTGLFLEES